MSDEKSLERSTSLSLEAKDIWIKSVLDNCPQGTVVALVGNKSDLEKSVSIGKVEDVATSHNFKYFETSSLTGANVLDVRSPKQEMFQAVCQEYVNLFLKTNGTNVKHLNDKYGLYGPKNEAEGGQSLSIDSKKLKKENGDDRSGNGSCCP